jgi:heat shock protein HtpX
VSRQEEPRLYNLLENLCISRGITMPTLRITDDDALNAFATGLNEKQYSITVTRGLMSALNDQEMEAVLGHELTHIRNGDVRMLVIAVVIAGVISFFGEMIFRLFFQNAFFGGRRSGGDGDRKGGAGAAIIIGIVLIVVAWILSIVIRFALSRRREFLADAGSVELTKNPDAMISALRKIEGRGELQAANSAVMEMCIDNPREGFADLFATHPSVDSRVDALVKFASGHDPGRLAVEYDEPGRLPAPEPDGPWGQSEQNESQGKPFLPDEPPVDLGGGQNGPWGPRRG